MARLPGTQVHYEARHFTVAVAYFTCELSLLATQLLSIEFASRASGGMQASTHIAISETPSTNSLGRRVNAVAGELLPSPGCPLTPPEYRH